MKTFFAVVGFVVVALIIGTCVACGNNNSEHRSLGKIQLISHERDRCYDDCGYDEGDGGDGGRSGGHQGYGGGGGRSGDNDQRGDHNCRNFCFYGVPLPGQGGGGGEKPQSLFPPTPTGIRDFVLQTIKASIELGRLFSDTTITFVENLMIGLA